MKKKAEKKKAEKKNAAPELTSKSFACCRKLVKNLCIMQAQQYRFVLMAGGEEYQVDVKRLRGGCRCPSCKNDGPHTPACAVHDSPYPKGGHCNCGVTHAKGIRLVNNYGRAQLGVNGNAGFALLGPNLQEGEAEFVTFEAGASLSDQLAACYNALNILRGRLGIADLSYYLGDSHPMSR